MAIKGKSLVTIGARTILSMIAIVLVTGCALSSTWKMEAREGSDIQQNTIMERKAEQLVSQMSDSEKIGQLMMIGLPGEVLDKDSRYMLTEFPNGNVILFDRNMKNLDQVKHLTADIQKEVLRRTGIPAFIAVDQEGGQVQRMQEYMPNMPSAKALGKDKPEETYQWAVKTGKVLKQIGINLNFAPVVDLDGAYERSYGKMPEEIIPYANAAIRGYMESGIMTCLKHFPGIGKVKTDPHKDGDVVMINRDDLDKYDGKPFKDIIAKMDSNKTFVMVSNVTFPLLEENVPACLSKRIMTDILQEKYKYKGLIFTDDMDMGAMAKHYSFSDVGVKSIETGADIILVCQELSHAQQVYNGLLKAYRDGTLDHKMIDEKVKRIILVKWKNLGHSS